MVVFCAVGCGYTWALADAPEPAGDPDAIAAFVTAIRPVVTELKKVSVEYTDMLNSRKDEKDHKDILSRYENARNQFYVAVSANWPFPISRDQPESEASKAYAEAFEFAKTYRSGQASREAAVQKYVDVADNYPGTLAHNQALSSAAHLYLQGFAEGVKRDDRKADALLERLVSSKGLFSTDVLWAEEELTGSSNDPTEKMKARSAFYLSAAEKSDDEWLQTHVLPPGVEMQPFEYIEHIEGILVQLHNVKDTSGANMISSAMGTPDPLISLNWLKKRHAGDAFLIAEIDKAIQYIIRTDYGYDEEKHHAEVIARFPYIHDEEAENSSAASSRPAAKAAAPATAARASEAMWKYLLPVVGVAVIAGVVYLARRRSRHNAANK